MTFATNKHFISCIINETNSIMPLSQRKPYSFKSHKCIAPLYMLHRMLPIHGSLNKVSKTYKTYSVEFCLLTDLVAAVGSEVNFQWLQEQQGTEACYSRNPLSFLSSLSFPKVIGKFLLVAFAFFG